MINYSAGKKLVGKCKKEVRFNMAFKYFKKIITYLDQNFVEEVKNGCFEGRDAANFVYNF